MRKTKLLAQALVFAMVASSVTGLSTYNSEAASAAPKLSSSKLQLKVGAKKNNKGKKDFQG